jgi:hypothetical protein
MAGFEAAEAALGPADRGHNLRRELTAGKIFYLDSS